MKDQSWTGGLEGISTDISINRELRHPTAMAGESLCPPRAHDLEECAQGGNAERRCGTLTDGPNWRSFGPPNMCPGNRW